MSAVYQGVTMPETNVWERQFEDVPEYLNWCDSLAAVDRIVALSDNENHPRPELAAAMTLEEQALAAWQAWLEGQGLL